LLPSRLISTFHFSEICRRPPILAASEIIFNRPLVPEVPELRAALWLTKLYQVTNRAPPTPMPFSWRAPEGFSTMPESPEIEETQTLLAAAWQPYFIAADFRFCAGFRPPGRLTYPRAEAAGGRKAPRHEVAGG
jgi:hypothetical protein